ncbi:MAG TPA: thiamine-phosphate kinase [Burkholderiales bacterium]|nr:thiamine-phosphate kinase [Burkholderiales bacterium]
MTEFELIQKFFAAQPVARDEVVIGIGDDAAVLTPPAGMQLVVTTDTLVEGVHFLPDADPADVGHKALAANLSDLAAMGAEPAWFLLNIVLPVNDEGWVHGFCEGLFALASTHKVQLVGGNTSRGPLVIAIEAHGFVSEGGAVRRSGAAPGDSIYVTGELGDAALALQHKLGERVLPDADFAAVRSRAERPIPRVREGMLLRRFASSAIDISDGLVADLGHVLEASGAGALIVRDRMPISDTYRKHIADVGWDLALGGGEDYELCFTVPARHDAEFSRWQSKFGCRVTCIGEIVSGPGLQILDAEGNTYRPSTTGYQHFAAR